MWNAAPHQHDDLPEQAGPRVFQDAFEPKRPHKSPNKQITHRCGRHHHVVHACSVEQCRTSFTKKWNHQNMILRWLKMVVQSCPMSLKQANLFSTRTKVLFTKAAALPAVRYTERLWAAALPDSAECQVFTNEIFQLTKPLKWSRFRRHVACHEVMEAFGMLDL